MPPPRSPDIIRGRGDVDRRTDSKETVGNCTRGSLPRITFIPAGVSVFKGHKVEEERRDRTAMLHALLPFAINAVSKLIKGGKGAGRRRCGGRKSQRGRGRYGRFGHLHRRRRWPRGKKLLLM